MDVVTLTAALAAVKKKFQTAPLTLSDQFVMPTSLGWDTTNYPVTVNCYRQAGNLPNIGVLATLPRAMFDAKSTVRTAPPSTFYVNSGTGITIDGLTFGAGVDTNVGSLAAPVKSISKAVSLGNATSAPFMVMVAQGSYSRANNPWNGATWGGGNTFPAQDMALIAVGRCISGSFDNISGARDGTYTNCSKFSVGNVERVVDVLNTNMFGNYSDLVNVSSVALCNTTPNSWYTDGSANLYVNRADQAIATNTNTRVFRPSTRNMPLNANTNIYIGGYSAGDGFDFEGGGNAGPFETDFSVTGVGTTDHVCVVENCTSRYAGGIVATTLKSWAVDSWRGLVIFNNCSGGASYTDGFNAHNTLSAAHVYMLTINCSSYDMGRFNASCNGWTIHDTVVGIDICGDYRRGHGGTMRSINTSKQWFVGTQVADDQGDIVFGGTLRPTAVEMDDTAICWMDSVKIAMPAGTYALRTAGSGTIHTRNMPPHRLPYAGTGTIDNYETTGTW